MWNCTHFRKPTIEQLLKLRIDRVFAGATLFRVCPYKSHIISKTRKTDKPLCNNNKINNDITTRSNALNGKQIAFSVGLGRSEFLSTRKKIRSKKYPLFHNSWGREMLVSLSLFEPMNSHNTSRAGILHREVGCVCKISRIQLVVYYQCCVLIG